MKNKDKNTNAKPDPAIRAITSFNELKGLLESELECRFKLDRKMMKLNVKRMSSAVSERQRAILRAVQPPYKRERNDYDPLDADYLKKRALAEEKARCVAVYCCCPVITAIKVCNTDDEMMALVNESLPKHLQELIALTAESGGLELVKPSEAANFIEPSGSAS